MEKPTILSEDEARSDDPAWQLIDSGRSGKITFSFGEYDISEAPKAKVTFKELDQFIALMFKDLGKHYGTQARQEIADGLLVYSLSWAGRTYVEIIMRDIGGDLSVSFADGVSYPDNAPQEDTRLAGVRKWINQQVIDFAYGSYEEYFGHHDPGTELGYVVELFPPEPAASMTQSATQKKRRGPNTGTLERCKDAMTQWLRKEIDFASAAQQNGIDVKTLRSRIPDVLAIMPEDERNEWVKLIKHKGKARYLGHFG